MPDSLRRALVNVATPLVPCIEGFAVASRAIKLVSSVSASPVFAPGLDSAPRSRAAAVIALTISEAVSGGRIMLDTLDAYALVAPFLCDVEFFCIEHLAVSIAHAEDMAAAFSQTTASEVTFLPGLHSGAAETFSLPPLDLSRCTQLRALHVHSARLVSWPLLPVELMTTLEFSSCSFAMNCAGGPWKFAASMPNLDTFSAVNTGVPSSRVCKQMFCPPCC